MFDRTEPAFEANGDATADARALPGYRRVLRVEPADGRVVAMLEDDIHCMAVTLIHSDGIVAAVEPTMHRMPWTPCPAAGAKLVDTFTGHALGAVTARVDKKQNCTHLHDLAVLGAAHAHDAQSLEYRCFVSDPRDGERILAIDRNGQEMHTWVERDGHFVSPRPIAGQTLFSLRDWIASLDGDAQEAARLLQWASIVAHGRTIPEERQTDATRMPPNCFTFQPERAAHAHRTGVRYDFSGGDRVLLAELRDRLAGTTN